MSSGNRVLDRYPVLGVSVLSICAGVGAWFLSRGAAFTLFLFISVPVIHWLMWREDFDGIQSEWRHRRALKSRGRRSPEQFFEAHYSTMGLDRTIVVKFLRFYADFWEADIQLLHPSDNHFAITGHCCDDVFAERVEAEFGAPLPRDFLEQNDGSLDSLIRHVCTH